MMRWFAIGLSILSAACGGANEARLERPREFVLVDGTPSASGERLDAQLRAERDSAQIMETGEETISIALLFERGEFALIESRWAKLAPEEIGAGDRRLIALALRYRGHYEASFKLLEEAFEQEQDLHALAETGELLLELGRIDEAEMPLKRIISAYNQREIAPDDAEAIFAVARAARLLGSARDANRAFEEAARLRRDDDAIELAWAELLLEAHAHTQATHALGRILRRAPEHAEARALLAEIYLAEAKPSRLARGEAERALALDPQNLRAQEILIRLAITLRDEEGALARIARLEEQTHRSVTSLTLRAGLAFLLDQRELFLAIEREVLEKNPKPVRFYESIADLAELDHRYDEAAVLAARALEAIPNDARSLARLGMNLLRIGREEEGRVKLKEAVSRDPFNRRVHLVLDLYETRIDQAYMLLERPPFRLRAHRSEAALIERFVLPYLESALQTLKVRYEFSPSEPIQIEFYRDPRDASIRAAGVPDLPFQAICFGNVITAVSPSVGGFNWGQILWHELAHVFHLQMSRGRAPRWLMEGLAERETMISPRAFQRPLAHRIQSFISARALPALSNFDALFSEARVMDELIASYGLSTLAVNYLEGTYGIKKIAELLRGFGEGRRFHDLVEAKLGVDAATLDAQFEAYLRELHRDRSARYEPEFDWYPAFEELSAGDGEGVNPAALAAILYRDGRRVEAAAFAKRALKAEPDTADALFVLAKVSGRREQAIVLLESILEQMESVGVRLELARLYTEAGDRDRARVHAARAIELDPERPEARMRMLDLESALGDHVAEIATLQELMALEPHSSGIAHRLLRRLADLRDYRRLLMVAEEAHFTSLFDTRVHLYRLIAAASLREYELARDALETLSALPGPLDGMLFREALDLLGRAGYRAERSALERLFMTPRHPR